jgi:hypothetical protein
MRRQMLGEHDYSCGVFIGGMEGVIDEFMMFRDLQPNIPVFQLLLRALQLQCSTASIAEIAQSLKANSLIQPYSARSCLRTD